MTEEKEEDVEFEVVIFDESNGFVPQLMPFEIQYNLLDKLQTHPVLLPTKPCKLTKEESYKIIRNYVKQHINYEYAEITSDYDFCFTVKKRIRLHEPVAYQSDISSFRSKKPKYVTKYRKVDLITCYEVAPKAYQSYTVVTPFEGKDYENLQYNIDTFLNNLMEEINKPFVECPHCNGMGVILDENKDNK